MLHTYSCKFNSHLCAQVKNEKLQAAALAGINKSEPKSKKVQMPGVGRGMNPNSEATRFVKDCRREEKRDPTLPTSVPMPATVEEVCDPGMRAMWENAAAMTETAAEA